MKLDLGNLALAALTSVFAVTLWNTLAGCAEVDEEVEESITIDAGDEQSVNEGSTVTLQATVNSSSPNGFGGLVEWSLTDSTVSGISFTTKTDNPTPIVAPFVDQTETLTFTAEALTSEQLTTGARDTVKIIVRDIGLEAPSPSFQIVIPGGALNFRHGIGSSPCPQLIGTFTVENGGGGELDWFATDVPSFVTISPSSGLAPNEVTAEFPCSGFNVGDNAGNIILESADGQTTSIPVSGNVQ